MFLPDDGDRIQFPKRCVLKYKQDGVSDKDNTMHNVQKYNICTNELFGLKHYMKADSLACHERESSLLFQCIVCILWALKNNVLIWMCEVWHTTQGIRLLIGYICVLFVGDGFKPRHPDTLSLCSSLNVRDQVSHSYMKQIHIRKKT
jgi:hypothetical protein